MSLFILLQHLRTCRFRLIYVRKQTNKEKKTEENCEIGSFCVRIVAILLISTVRCHLAMLEEDEPKAVLVINGKQHVTMYVCVRLFVAARAREDQKEINEMKNEKWC